MEVKRFSLENERRGLNRQCPRLGSLIQEHLDTGLDRKTWKRVMRALVNTGHIRFAKFITRESPAYKPEQNEFVDKLSMQRKNKRTCCIKDFGCDNVRVQYCYGRSAPSSPEDRISFSIAQKELMGLQYSEESSSKEDKKKSFSGINGNAFARFLLENYEILRHDSGRYYAYLNNYWQALDEMKLKKVLRNFFQCLEFDKWSLGLEKAYMGVLPYECLDMNEVKPATNYVCVRNGLLNLKTFNLVEHSQEVFCTVQIPVRYNPKASCEKFRAFLSSVCCSDVELERLVQEMMGYCLCSHVKAQKMFLLTGAGSNGKSTFLEILRLLVGGDQNVSSVSLGDLGKKFERSQIVDKALNVSSENHVKDLDAQSLKACTSGDSMQFERKFEQPFTYRPFAKLVFAVNDLPDVSDTSHGFARRVVLIPFNQVFTNTASSSSAKRLKADLDILKKITPEMEGIFAFAVEGLKRLTKNDFKFSESKQASMALEQFLGKVNPLRAFMAERTQVLPIETKGKVLAKDLHKAFCAWCKKNGYLRCLKELSSLRSFLPELRKLLGGDKYKFCQEKKSNGKQWVMNLKLKQK